jgi:hypothetical protein
MPSKKPKYTFKLLIPAAHKAQTLFHDEKLAELYAEAVCYLKDEHVPGLIEDHDFDPDQWNTAGDQFLWVHHWIEEAIDFDYQQQKEKLQSVRESFLPKKTEPVLINDALKAKVVEMTKAGKSAAAIAKVLGISAPTVQNLKKSLGLVKKR